MNLSLSDWVQLIASGVAILAPIAGALPLAIGKGAPKWSPWLLILSSLIYAMIVGVIFQRNPSISTLTLMGTSATALGMVMGGVSWLVAHRGEQRNKFIVPLFVVLVTGFVVMVAFTRIQGPQTQEPLPFPTTPPPSTAFATATPSQGTVSSPPVSSPTRVPTQTPETSGSGGASPTPTFTTRPGPVPTPTLTPTPQPTPTPIPLSNQAASASIASTTPNGCYPEVQVSGTITTNGGQGTIDYFWGRSDGSKSPASGTYSISASSGTTTYNVSDTWYPQVSGSPATYWDTLFATSPNSVASNQASESLHC